MFWICRINSFRTISHRKIFIYFHTTNIFNYWNCYLFRCTRINCALATTMSSFLIAFPSSRDADIIYLKSGLLYSSIGVGTVTIWKSASETFSKTLCKFILQFIRRPSLISLVLSKLDFN